MRTDTLSLPLCSTNLFLLNWVAAYSVVSIICLFELAKCVYPNTQTLCEILTWKFLTCMQMSKLFTDSWVLQESSTQKSQICVEVTKIYTAFIRALRCLHISDGSVIWGTRKSVKNVDGIMLLPQKHQRVMYYCQLKMLKCWKIWTMVSWKCWNIDKIWIIVSRKFWKYGDQARGQAVSLSRRHMVEKYLKQIFKLHIQDVR